MLLQLYSFLDKYLWKTLYHVYPKYNKIQSYLLFASVPSPSNILLPYYQIHHVYDAGSSQPFDTVYHQLFMEAFLLGIIIGQHAVSLPFSAIIVLSRHSIYLPWANWSFSHQTFTLIFLKQVLLSFFPTNEFWPILITLSICNQYFNFCVNATIVSYHHAQF